MVGLPLLLALVLGAAWADEPFLFFLSEWYRAIRVAAPYYYDGRLRPVRTLAGSLGDKRRRHGQHLPDTFLRVAQPLLMRLAPDLSPNALTV